MRHHRPKPRNAVEKPNSKDNVAAHEGAMKGNHGGLFGLKTVSHCAAGVGDLKLSPCAVFKALDIMPSLDHESNHLPF